MLSDKHIVTKIGRYLIDTAEKSLICEVDKQKGLECYVNADFAEGWNPNDRLNGESVLFRNGFVIMHTGILIYWKSKLQTEIALSTCEAEYIALSSAMREVIPLV